MGNIPNPPNGTWYGGANVEVQRDGAGTRYIGGMADLNKAGPEGFAFAVCRWTDQGVTRLRLEDDWIDARGSLYVDQYTGLGRYTAYKHGNVVDGAIPGWVPIAPATLVSSPGQASTDVILKKIAILEQQIRALELRQHTVDLSSVYKDLEGLKSLANKANDRALNALNQMQKGVFVRSAELEQKVNDLIWNNGKVVDRVFAEVSNTESGLSKLINPAQLELRVQHVETSLATLEPVETWWANSIQYRDTRLLNLLWDRTVKLLRHKEKYGLRAEELSLNNP